jgi:hypothetical protein
LGQACHGVSAPRRAACFSSLKSVILDNEKSNTEIERRKAPGLGPQADGH